jgi:6-phosphogluconolactonase
MLKKLEVLSVFFLVLFVFAGCQENQSPVTGPGDVQSLDKGVSDNWGRSNGSAVYTLSNSPGGNEVIMFRRNRHGNLSLAGSFSTGGLGTGAGLGSQGAVVLADGFLFTVNAGSDEISVMSFSHNGLTLANKVSSGGTIPISLTVHRHLLYVLNAGADGNITGFRISRSGELTPIPGSTQPLSGSGVGPAQIEFNPWGNVLVVTEKGTNSIDTYVVGYDGVAGPPNTQASTGDTPFGFEFDGRGHLIVSDAFGGGAGLGAMSSYNVSAGGISLITGPVANGQAAPCWVVVTKNGRFTYTSNTATNNISGYKIGHNGSLTLFNDGGNTAPTGAGPIDMSISNDSQYLYCLNSGNQTISVFRINNRHGGLTSIQTVNGLPVGSAGLAAN